jgi:hypothetical protein
MRRNSQSAPAAILVLLSLCVPALQVLAQPVGLPEAVLRAHNVFLENETGFSELQYTAILELGKWGHFELAESRAKADLILRLSSGTHVRAVPDGQFPRAVGLNGYSEDAVPAGHTRISLLDPKSGAMLWSDLHKTEGGKVKSGHLLDGLREAFDRAHR